jgi:hypothetical protein
VCCGDVGGRGAWLGVVVSYLTQGAATMVKVAAAQRGSLPRGVLTAAAHRPEWHAVFGPPHDGTSAARKQLGGERETARAAHTQLRMHLLIRNAARSVRVCARQHTQRGTLIWQSASRTDGGARHRAAQRESRSPPQRHRPRQFRGRAVLSAHRTHQTEH